MRFNLPLLVVQHRLNVIVLANVVPSLRRFCVLFDDDGVGVGDLDFLGKRFDFVEERSFFGLDIVKFVHNFVHSFALFDI